MKIEIELSEVEQMRDRIKYLEAEQKQLQRDLEMYDRGRIQSKVRELAAQMYEAAISAVAEKIGMEWQRSWAFDDVDFIGLEKWEPWCSWGQNPEVRATVGANITNSFAQMYVRLGIDRMGLKPKPADLDLGLPEGK